MPVIEKNASADPNRCKVCSKVVYEMEKKSIDGVSYHKSCFRCAKCNGQLTTSFSAYGGVYYCRGAGKCFEQLFRLSGRYDNIAEGNAAFANSEAPGTPKANRPPLPSTPQPKPTEDLSSPAGLSGDRS